MRNLLARARAALPEGKTLPDDAWRRRHGVLRVLLWIHVPALGIFGALGGYGPLHLGGELGIIAILAVAAGSRLIGRRARSIACAVGLVSCSALLVHLSGGYIEMHFHYFVMVALLSLYEDWVAFLIAIGFVVLQHGVAGVLDVHSVYNHPDGIAHPWKWASIHGGFVLAASAAAIATWRINEISRRREREAADHLRALDEMKNSFLQAVSHELRTPLTSVIGISATLHRVGASLEQDERGELIGRVAANARKLQRLLDDLLDLDRLSRGVLHARRRTVSMDVLVRALVEDFGRGVVHVDAEPVRVAVDGPKVERILENLLTNAFKYTPEGTPIWVRVRERDCGVEIVVEDAGPGVPDELKAVVFEPFRRAAAAVDAVPGTGIGLSLVTAFVELHSGSVRVEDRDGGGARFRVFLPDGPEEPTLDAA